MSPRWLHWPAFWSPSDLADLRAWYDADDSTTIFDATTGGSLPSSGNDVGRWEDKSGGGYHVTQATAANRPHYVTNTLNGKPVIECTAQWLTAATASDWNFLHNTSGSTVVIVWKAGTSADPNAAYSAWGTSGLATANHGQGLFSDDRTSLSRNEAVGSIISRGVLGEPNANVVSSNGAHSPNAPTIVSFVGDPGNATAANRVSLRVNGGTPTGSNTETHAASTSNATFAFQVGAGGNDVLPLTGYIAEVVICDAKLSDANREKVEGYLAHKWGLETNLPSTHPYRNSAP